MDKSHSPIAPEVMDDLMQKTKKLLNFADYPPDSGTNSRHKPNNGQLPRHYGEYTLSDAFVQQLRAEQLKHVHPGYTPAHFETTFRETATTCHWMHAWHQNGHRHTPDMTPSTDMWGNGRIGVGVKVQAYHTQTDLVRRILKEVALYAMPPIHYARYLSAYRAGNLIPSLDLNGIFLGQVAVSNCYSYTHADSLDGDDGWCMTFASYGHEGAMMVFPELGVIVKYDPHQEKPPATTQGSKYMGLWGSTEDWGCNSGRCSIL